MVNDFQLGQRVAYSEHIQRRHTRSGEFDLGGPNRIWSNHSGPYFKDQPYEGGEGVIVGKRTLSNGRAHWQEEGYTEYTVKETFTAYLIAHSLSRKPVHVLPEHITALDELAAPDDDDQHFKDTGCDSSLHPDDCLATKQGVLL